MKEMTLEELQQVEYELLRRFSDFCEEHALNYFLAYGTLIGAARHKGFIPWDDDVDVVMPRDDYERLLALYEDDDEIVLLTSKKDEQYCYPFAKLVDTRTAFVEKNSDKAILGVFIDVFPLDGVSSNRLNQRMQAILWRLLRVVSIHGYNVSEQGEYFRNGQVVKGAISAVVRFLFSVVKYSNIDNLMNGISLRHPYSASEYVYCYWQTYSLESVPKKWFESYVRLPFGDGLYRVPVGWHEWNTHIYGDYMTPPKDKGHTHGRGYWL